MTDSNLLISSLIIIAILACVFIVIISAFSKLNQPKLDKEKYRKLWDKVEKSLDRNNPGSFHLSVLQADKLLDHALKERNVKGSTMGERMKSVQGEWLDANSIWGAHKLRNRIAHEPEIDVKYSDSKRALNAFKQALKDVGAL